MWYDKQGTRMLNKIHTLIGVDFVFRHIIVGAVFIPNIPLEFLSLGTLITGIYSGREVGISDGS